MSPKTIRIDASYAKGTAKLAEPFRRDVLSRHTKVPRKAIIQLGDAEPLDVLIETPAQLQAVLTPQPLKSDRSTSPLRPVEKRHPTSVIHRRITSVVRLAASLEKPNANVKLLSQQLLSQVQRLVTYCEPTA